MSAKCFAPGLRRAQSGTGSVSAAENHAGHGRVPKRMLWWEAKNNREKGAAEQLGHGNPETKGMRHAHLWLPGCRPVVALQERAAVVKGSGFTWNLESYL